MKYLIILLLSTLLISCSPTEEVQKAMNHRNTLRKLNVSTTTTKSSSAYFLLIGGGYSSHESTNTTVRFYFLNWKDEYQLMERPLTNVNIKIDSTVTEPYVTFEWSGMESSNVPEMRSDIYEWHVRRATIHCKDSDFQPDININDLK